MFDSDKEQTSPEGNDDNSSSSESDSYLQKPEDLNLNSTFFKINATSVLVKRTTQFKAALSDSDSDDALSTYVKKGLIPSTSKASVDLPSSHDQNGQQAFKDQNNHALELEEAKKQVEAYIARRKSENSTDTADVSDLLALGEKPFDLAKDLAEVGFHPSDFESGNESEKEDWEEVQESQEQNIIPKQGVEITVSMPDTIKKRKGIDLMAALKRRMNRIMKENQIYIHKVHLLCWIAHGNYVNNILNKDNIMAMALSLLPTKDCYPPTRTNLKYLEQITKWYHKSMKYQPDMKEKNGDLEATVLEKIGDKVATSATVLVYVFVSMLRALGMQCRLVLSLQVASLRPPTSELCSLKQDSNSKPKKGDLKSSKADKSPSESKRSAKVADTKINQKKHSKESSKNDNTNNKAVSKTSHKKSPAATANQAKKNVTSKLDVVKLGYNDDISLNKDVGKVLDAQKSPKERQKIGPHSNKPNLSKLMKSSSTESETGPLRSSKDFPKTSNKSNSKGSAIKCDKPNLAKLRQGSTENESIEMISMRQTRSRSKKVPSEKCNDHDFKKPDTLSVHPKAGRSKSASDVTNSDKKAGNNLPDVPKDKLTSKRSKSATREKAKKTAISSIDATIATLEALEGARLPAKERGSGTSISSCDSDMNDRSIWRRSKSPQVPKEGTNISTDVSVKIPAGRHILREKAPKTNPALMDSMFQSEDERVKQKNKNKIKVRVPRKRNLPQLDGVLDESITSSDDDMLGIYQADGTDDKCAKPKLRALKSPRTAPTQDVNLNQLKSPTSSSSTKSSPSKTPQIRTSSTSSYFSPDKTTVKDVIIGLVKKSRRDEKEKSRGPNYRDEDSDSDFLPEASKKKKPSPNVKVKKRVLPRKQLEALAKEKTDLEKEKKKGIDIWVEIFLEEEEKWISADVVSGKVHCVQDIYNKASHPVSYILSWDNIGKVKDVTKRYCPHWNTVTRKLRTEAEWWSAALKPYSGIKTARDKEEDEDLARQQLDQPLPKTISEYKDHPLYVLKRHLLKFQALYPPNPPVLGFVRNEEVYSRDCVYILHSRDIWLKHAKVVRPGEQPYKIVKARPKYDKLSNTMITDQLLEIFGVWQVEDYQPPTAKDGVVPRNAYGNVELFKPCMLPKKCVHLQLPGLKKVAAKLKIDCAPAVTGFDFHGGWNHAIHDGFIVCEEFKDVLIAAWEQEQEEITKREVEKYEKRVYGNWRRLIKAALIRRRLKSRYDFSDQKPDLDEGDFLAPSPDENTKDKMEESPPKKKRPKFMARK